MTIISGFIQVSKAYKSTHPQLNLSKGWFGSSSDNESISLNGAKVNSVEFGTLLSSVSQERMNTDSFKSSNPYWLNKECLGIDSYHIYLGFDTFEGAEDAFKIPVYELGDGVLLCLSGMIDKKPSSYKEVKPS